MPAANVTLDAVAPAKAAEKYLSMESLRRGLLTLRRAARSPVANVRGALRASSLRARADAIYEAWLHDRDYTVYGICNAIAGDAKRLSTLRCRFEAEAATAQLLRRFASAAAALEESAVGE
jgi:hypothetical protein